MAAGTDITHPVSALEGVYKPLPLEALPVCTTKQNGDAADSNHPSCDKNGKEREGMSKPPRPTTVTGSATVSVRRCVSTVRLNGTTSELVGTELNDLSRSDSEGNSKPEFLPVIRSGICSDIGVRENMEDTHVCIDNLVQYLGACSPLEFWADSPGAFYGVFDGHGGKDAAQFVRENLLGYIVEDVAVSTSIEDAVRSAFLRTDQAFAEACDLDQKLSSGTTALTVLVVGRTVLVANAGDCRAVLCRRGKAVDMSRDHKADSSLEKLRIEAVGGYVDDGYLNGQLAVTRAIGDWHMQGLKEQGIKGPLSAEPELQHEILSEEDEFMIIGCDGLWDVFSSQNAVDYARRKLQQHNDPERCSVELVKEALRRETCDNLTVVTVCFSADPPPRLGGGWTPRFRRSISAEGLRNLQGFLDGDP